MRTIPLLALSVVLLFSSISCNNDQPTAPDTLAGSYEYAGFDSSGTAVVHGTLRVNMTDSVRISGTWSLVQIGTHIDLGPQTGGGTLAGFLRDDTLFSANLNPGWVDNNVLLEGAVRGSSIAGTWIWGTESGVSNRGTFLARKIALAL